MDGVLAPLPCGSPNFAPILEVLTLLQLLIGEGQAGHEDHPAFLVLPCAFIDVVPCLYATSE